MVVERAGFTGRSHVLLYLLNRIHTGIWLRARGDYSITKRSASSGVFTSS